MAEANPSRRDLVAGTAAGLACTSFARFAIADEVPSFTIDAARPGPAISALVFGSNEIGVMDGGAASATLDRIAGVGARRLGGNLMTSYNWVSNASNAGSGYGNSNGAFLLEALQIPKGEWSRPGVVVESMHEASLAIGAKSLVTLPVAPYVAADFAGVVTASETAPSPRFVETCWKLGRAAGDPVDPKACDIPQFLARLLDRYGDAGASRGVYGYALDNEPDLWTKNHPRIAPQRLEIATFLARSIAAARAIKTIDPKAKVFGPASWGATGMVSFQNAPDWPRYSRYGNFLALYLDAFRQASEKDGRRLLDCLDVHWYPFSNRGALFRTDDPALDGPRLDAPRSLSEPGFAEDSWVSRALRHGAAGDLTLPILPALSRIADEWFPGVGIAITEFNYGGGARMPSALALADALGRYAENGVAFATHWGSLAGLLTESYRLYRAPDGSGSSFGGRALPVSPRNADGLSCFAADNGRRTQVVVLNKRPKAVALDLAVAGEARLPAQAFGLDADRRRLVEIGEQPERRGGGWRIVLPALSARRYAFA